MVDFANLTETQINISRTEALIQNLLFTTNNPFGVLGKSDRSHVALWNLSSTDQLVICQSSVPVETLGLNCYFLKSILKCI